jgi:PAS domain S-box-containing protein
VTRELAVAGEEFDSATALEVSLEASPNGILVIDDEGRIVLANGEVERQFGYTRQELLGQPVEMLVAEGLRSVHTAHRRSFDRAAGAHPMGVGRELFGRRRDGSLLPVEIGLRPIDAPRPGCVLAAITDVTERRRYLEEQRAALEDQREFDRLLAELSFQFINLPDDQVAASILKGLERTCLQIGLDRASFVRINADGELFDLVTWTRPGIESIDLPHLTRERFPWVGSRVLAGELVSFSSLEDIQGATDRESYRETGAKSGVVVPLQVGGRVAGVLGLHAVQAERPWPAPLLDRVRVVTSVFEQALARQLRDEAARAAALEVQHLKEQLQAEAVYLRQEVRERLGPTGVVGQSAAVRRVMEQIQQVAATDSTVLLLGETGTGKELFATQIHELGSRRSRPMVRVNCAAIPATLIESELFGREKGAYTGALARQVGRFELADHSTIFLDEIGDLPADVQVKLLRVLEERRIERLGSPRSIPIDTRIIAATHRNLEQRIADGAFREDLYYRLNVFPIRVPPLRERLEDIPLLVWRFVEEFSKAFGKRIESIDRDSLAGLQQYAWPGNIRELRHVVERAMITTTTRKLTIAAPQASAAAVRRSPRLIDVEREHIRSVLESTGWRIRGVGGAADRLGLKPTTLETRMAKLGLRRPGQ